MPTKGLTVTDSGTTVPGRLGMMPEQRLKKQDANPVRFGGHDGGLGSEQQRSDARTVMVC